MKRLTLSFLVTAASLTSYAQKESNNWYFGYTAGVTFSSGAPVAQNGGLCNSAEGNAAISDPSTGNLLFYTDGSTVRNKNNLVMANGLVKGSPSATQSAIIIPMPGSNKLYYLFTLDAQDGFYTGNAGALAYSIIDMSLSGGLGAVTTKDQLVDTGMTEKLTAYRHCNGVDFWVLTHKWNSNAFYAYLVTASGVSLPVISNSGAIHKSTTNTFNGGSAGYMKISPDGTMIGLACCYDMRLVEAFPFDNSTGIVGPPIFTDLTWTVSPAAGGPYGLTFSPDSRSLYASVYKGNNIYQYDLKAGNRAAILASKTLIGRSTGNVVIGALQTGSDGKIYVAQLAVAALDVINNPNVIGLGCGFVENAVPLLANSGLGLPNFPENFPVVPFAASLAYSACGNSGSLSFYDSTLYGNKSILWNFGDVASGASNSSTLQNPTHHFSASGTYSVKLYLSNACITDSFISQVTIADSATAKVFPADTSFCMGNFVQLQATGGLSYKWSPSTEISDTTIANPVVYPSVTTTYTVTTSTQYCGTSTATSTIHIYPSPPVPTIVKSNDTLFCSTDTSYFSYQWYALNVLIPGATDTFFIATKDGNYNVEITGTNGCKIAVGANIILGQPGSFQDSHIILSPNPAGNELEIKNLQVRIDKMEIYNAFGQRVLSTIPLPGKGENINIDVSKLAYGVYFVKLSGENGQWEGRFVKE